MRNGETNRINWNAPVRERNADFQSAGVAETSAPARLNAWQTGGLRNSRLEVCATRLRPIRARSVASDRRFLARAFRTRGDFVFARLVFALAFADLLLDFFGDEIDRRVEIALAVFGEEIGAADGEADRAGELS